ncbi:EH signature domain-containing protein [Rhizobium redzepovicii]|uniref:EH signature domain-containing protein n=1 Tax=Rhizobium redzepovicii TaxID=2867518 RepID=UPI0028722C96|nr:EH signature domain-containing protein [Rhizobium redzepovicii]MDR9779593.1 EH signature domain-containing protein [Rhizobium redzepovicii]
MTGIFREACASVSTRTTGFSVFDLIPKLAHTQRIAQEIGTAGMEDAAQRDPDTWNHIAARLLPLLDSGLKVTTTDLRDAIWCLWEAKPSLAEHQDVLERIVEEVDRSERRKLFRTLATVYLMHFQADRAGMEQVSSVLQRGSVRWGEPFSGYQSDYALYDPVLGPRNIAALALKKDVSPADAMESLGFGALDARSGFTEAVTRDLFIALADGAEPDHMKRLAKVRSYALDSRNELIFRGFDLEIAEALMKPFLGKPPEKSIKDTFLNFIVSIFGDPRLPRSSGRWDRFPSIKALVVSWLTEQSLRQFLDIVGRTIDDRDDQQMWLYRRAFWEAAHRKGIIQGAWVVFGEDGASLARHHFGKNIDFGRFTGGRVQRTHAVLLLQIGRGIVADWSHDGKVNIWSDASEAGAPKLYKKQYSADEVTITRSRYDINTPQHLMKTHSAPGSYSWQRVVAERIYRMTNTRLLDSDYAVKGR